MIKQATVEWWNTVPDEFRFAMIKRAQGNFLGDAWKSVQGFGKGLWNGLGEQGQRHVKNFAIGAGASMIPFGIYKAMGGKGGWGAGIGTALAGGALGVATPYAKDYVTGLMGNGQQPAVGQQSQQGAAPAPATPPPAGPPAAAPVAPAPVQPPTTSAPKPGSPQ